MVISVSLLHRSVALEIDRALVTPIGEKHRAKDGVAAGTLCDEVLA